MSFINDIRGVSEAAMAQLAERFGDLPRPLLAAIGAGDFAVERLAELREALTATLEKTASTTDARGFAADFPVKAQEAAAEVIESMQKFTFEMPVKTQALVEQLPQKAADIREALSPEQMKAAVDGYTTLASVIYGSLAERGSKMWSAVVATAGVDSKVVDAADQPAEPAAPEAEEPAAVLPVVRPDPVLPVVRPEVALPVVRPEVALPVFRPEPPTPVVRSEVPKPVVRPKTKEPAGKPKTTNATVIKPTVVEPAVIEPDVVKPVTRSAADQPAEPNSNAKTSTGRRAAAKPGPKPAEVRRPNDADTSS